MGTGDLLTTKAERQQAEMGSDQGSQTFDLHFQTSPLP